jgi:heme/copper-type cytochrome/quinol oxidase subunit 3
MTAQRTLDVSHLPYTDISPQAPIWWGQFLLAIIEGTMFAILIAMYFYIRTVVDPWPPPGTQLPRWGPCTWGWIPLLISTAGSYIASEGAKKNERSSMIGGLALNLVMALAFLGLRAWSWGTFNFNWKTDIHGSLVWTIMWLHTFDMAADLIFTAVLILVLVLGRYGGKERAGVHVDSIVWYFLVLIWIPLYLVVFWGPRFVGTA